MTKWKSRALTLALAGLLTGQAVLPVLAEAPDTAGAGEPAANVMEETPVAETPESENVVPGESTGDVPPAEEIVDPSADTPITVEPADGQDGDLTTETPSTDPASGEIGDAIADPNETSDAETPTGETGETSDVETPTEETGTEVDPAADLPAEEDALEEDPIEDIGTEQPTEERVRVRVESETSGEQIVLSLPDGYAETDSMTKVVKGAQQNGRDSGSSSDGQLVKTAEWTDYDAGTGEINLTYAVPAQKTPTSAVIVYGTCVNHGFSRDIAETQALELLERYDEVTVITTRHRDRDSYIDTDVVYGKTSKIEFTLYADDSTEANQALFESKTFSNNVIDDGIGTHATGLLAIDYLTDYLADHDPTGIYISFDGERIFAGTGMYTSKGNSDSWTHGMRYAELTAASDICYDMSPDSADDLSLSELYDRLALNQDTIRTLAEYQVAGRYYVCLPNPVGDGPYQYLRTAFYNNSNNASWFVSDFSNGHHVNATIMRNLTYASFAYIDPYNFVHHQDRLIHYLSDSKGSKAYEDAYFDRVGQPLIYYGQSFADNGTAIVYNSATFTDTIAEGLAIDEAGITVTVDGAATDPRYVVQSIDGNKLTISVAQIQIGQTVNIKIPIRLADGVTGFSQNHSYAPTNVGNAQVTAADGRTVTVGSPRLYKGAFRITTKAEHGSIDDDVTGILPGDNVTISYQADPGYDLETIRIDGEEVDPKAYPTSYPFTEILQDHTIEVIFVPSFTITTEVLHGTITDSITGIRTGEDAQITYSPDNGYTLQSVTVDGEEIDIKVYPSGYFFANITGDHTIKVVYVRVKTPQKGDDSHTDKETHHETTEETTHNKTTENVQVINKVITNETVVTESGADVPQTPAPAAPTEETVTESGSAIITTGDDSRMMVYAGIAVIAAMVLAGSYVRRRMI